MHPLHKLLGLALVAWGAVLVLWGPAPYVMAFDDAYYYFEIAARIRAGEGSTFDGENRTNGYHPLWMLLCTLWPPSGSLGMRAVLLLQLGLSLGAMAWVGRVVVESDRARSPGPTHGPWLAAMFGGILLGPLALKASVNGLESALYVALIAVLLHKSWAIHGAWQEVSRAERLVFALVASLAFLARTDAALWLLCWGISSLPAAWRARGPGLLRLAERFALPAATIVAFMAFNHRTYGAAVQISGLVKRSAVEPTDWALVLGAVVGSSLLAWLVGRTRGAAGRWVSSTAGFAVGLALMLAYYAAFQNGARPWYYAPHLLYGAVFATCGAIDLIAREHRESEAAARRMRALLVLPLVGMGLAQFAAWPVYADLIELREGQRALGERLTVVADPIRVGSWDAGLVGYAAQRPVTNLDGLVNSLEYLNAVRAGQAPAWLAERDVRAFANHSVPEEQPCGQLLREATKLAGEELGRQLTIRERWLSPSGEHEFCIVSAL